MDRHTERERERERETLHALKTNEGRVDGKFAMALMAKEEKQEIVKEEKKKEEIN